VLVDSCVPGGQSEAASLQRRTKDARNVQSFSFRPTNVTATDTHTINIVMKSTEKAIVAGEKGFSLI
jgi:hypothetical protein